MTKEEFDKLEDKWQTVYLDGKTPIQMVSKKSSKEDCILWYDSDEYAHTAHYSKIELRQNNHQKELEKIAKKESEVYGLLFADYSHHCQVNRQEGFYDGFKAGFIKSEEVFLKKACEWLKDELDKLAMDKVEEDFLQNEFRVILKEDVPKWIDDFRKAMKK